MITQIDAQSQSQGTRSDKEECRDSSHGGRGKGVGRISQEFQRQSFPFVGDDRTETNPLSSTGSGDAGEIIEQLISNSLLQAKQHEDTAVILREQAEQLKQILSTINQTNNNE